ncbi:MAG: hypothetical protein SWQ30_14480 [Thermodesulfobacteriota bacterium]|nr:hypothetical protein [Thermodesulfobacteriota bacterium]
MGIKGTVQSVSLTKWTAIIALATILYCISSVVLLLFNYDFLQQNKDALDINRRIFYATYRPFLGTEDVNWTLGEDKSFDIKYEFKNFGDIPARNVITNWKVLFGDKELPQEAAPDRPSILFPKDTAFLHARLGEKYSNMILANAASLRIEFNITYRGVTEEIYETTEIHQFTVWRDGAMGFAILDGNWT